jgi:hypothetical protein
MNDGQMTPSTPAANCPNHGIIAYASSPAAPLQSALGTLYLPQLSELLGKLTCVSQGVVPTEPPHDPSHSEAYLLPHEIAMGLWGQSPQWGPDALITPCHWQVGMNEVVMLNPAEILLTEMESRDLLAAIQAYFVEDGLTVSYESPMVWRAHGNMFQGLPFAALEKVIDRNVKAWMPSAGQARQLQRLQSEMQMLLYQHPVNDQRSLRGQWTINSFWVHREWSHMYRPPHPAQIHLQLQFASAQQNAALWCQQWQNLDATVCKSLRDALSRQEDVSITLCSDTAWRHYRPRKASVFNALQRMFSPISVRNELRALIQDATTP